MSSFTDILGKGDPIGSLIKKGTETDLSGQQEATEAANAELRRQFDIQQERLQPFFDQSSGAIDLLSQFSGAQGDAAQGKAISGLLDSPGAKFRREQAQKNVLRNASVSGGLGGGNVLKQAQQQGISSAQQELSDEQDRLASIAGISQSAGSQLGRAGGQFSSSLANNLNQGASNQANQVIGNQQNTASIASSAAGLVGLFSDKEMKKDIREMSNEECYNTLLDTPIKAWRYLEELGVDEDAKERLGPLYQEAPDCIKFEGMKALDLHDELWLIAGAIKHFAENK